MSKLCITLFGLPEIAVADVPFTTDRRKAIALLAYLAVSGKAQPRDHLMGFFWPEYDRKSAASYLRRTLWELNNGLGRGWLQADRQTVSFDPANVYLDTAVFEANIQASKTAENPILFLEEAVALYKSGFLDGFYLQDTDPFANWQQMQANYFQRGYAAVLERLVALYEQNGQLETALAHAHTWLALDELNEPAHRAIMTIYASLGDRTKAIRQYETCAETLQREIGAAPQPETTALYQSLIRETVTPATATLEKTAVSSLADKYALPVLTTPFIGRRPELEQINTLLLQPDNRLLTLVGPGGSGKTRLSLQAAEEAKTHFSDGVWFVPLAAVQTAKEIIPAIARSLQFSFYREEEQPEQQLLEYLREKQLLLILDNLEQLVGLETDELLLKLLTGAANVKIMATTRTRLNIPGEQLYKVTGMRLPAPEDAASWLEPAAQAKPFSAIQLFLERARRIRPNFQLTQANTASVATICQLVAGLPLGIELATSWLALLSPDEIAAEMRQSLDILETQQSAVPERQRSIRAVFDYSWKLLNASEQKAFLNLCVFVGSFTREAAQEISGASLRVLLSLANKSWLQQTENGRFQLHRLLEHYGLDRSKNDEQSYQQVRDQHARYYANLVAKLAAQMRGPQQAAALDTLAADFSTNIKAAWRWLIENEKWDDLLEKMGMGLYQFGIMRSGGLEMIRWLNPVRTRLAANKNNNLHLPYAIFATLELFIEEAAGIADNLPERRLEALWQYVAEHDLAQAMSFWFVELAAMYRQRHPTPEVSEQLDEAIERVREQNDPWLLALSFLVGSGSLYVDPDQLNEANLQEAWAIFEELDDPFGKGAVLNMLAHSAYIQARPLEEVVDVFLLARTYHLQAGDYYGAANIFGQMGGFYLQNRDMTRAAEAYAEQYRLLEQIGNRRVLGWGYHWESLYASRYSKYEHALETRQRCISYFEIAGTGSDLCWARYEMGEIYRIYGQMNKAREYFELSRADFDRWEIPLGQGYYQRSLGDMAMQAGAYAQALQHYNVFLRYVEGYNHLWSIAEAQAKLAWANSHLAEIDMARGQIQACLAIIQNMNELQLEHLAMLAEVRCRVEEGKTQAAIELALTIANHPRSWNETRILAQNLVERLS